MITNSELIGKYFDKSLTEEEKVLFKQKYETEPDFKQAVKEQAQVIVALKASGLEKEILCTQPIAAAKTKKIWLYVSMSVAAAAILLLAIIPPTFTYKTSGSQGITELQKTNEYYQRHNVELQEQIRILSSSNREQKVLLEESQQEAAILRDSLQKKPKTDTQASNTQTTNARFMLLALNQSSDIKHETKGTGDFGFYPSNEQNRMNPNNTIIKWTSVNQQGALYLYKINEQNQQIRDSNFPKFNQDLNSGSITLKGLEGNSFYVFMIILNEKEYKFTFITQ